MLIPRGGEKYAAQHRTSVADYVASVTEDATNLKRWLVPGDVLDIGCGLGGASVLIAKHCGGVLHVLDGTGWADRRIGYGPTMEPFNDMQITEEMIRLNGIARFQCWPVGASDLPPVDNVVSLLSWVWHYPASVYLSAVTRALRPGGSLIVDVRDGRSFSPKGFEFAGVVQRLSRKGARVCWRRVIT